MAIKEEEQKKNGMKIIDNMDGAKSAEDREQELYKKFGL